MRRCESCGVFVMGHSRCPLCQGELTGKSEEGEARVYPSYRRQRRSRFVWRLLEMLVVIACAVSVLQNLMRPGPASRMAAAYVTGGGICVLIEMAFFQRLRGSVARIISDQALLVGILCIIWDAATGFHGWSTRYVVPLLLVGALIGMEIVRLAARQHFSDYGIRVLAMSMICVAFSLLLGEGWAAMTCATGGICAALELLFLEGRKLYAELARRFHL